MYIPVFLHSITTHTAIIKDGEILAAAQEERFTRKNTIHRSPLAIVIVWKECNITIDQLEAVVFYDKPLLKFERLLETYYAFAPKGFVFLPDGYAGVGEWKLFLKKSNPWWTEKIQKYNKRN